MRRTVRSVALSLALVPGLLVGPGIAARAQAGVGTEVPYVDAEGVTHGTVLIKEVGDPFTGADPARPAPEGERYVGLSVAFTAADDQTFDANPSWVILRDTDGGLHSPTYVPRLPDDKVPDLQAQVMAPGNRISGFIGYSVPTDAVIDEILYVDSSTDALPLADLVPTAGPAAGSPVDYVADDGSQGQFTISVADPFVGFDPQVSGTGGFAVRRPERRRQRPRRCTIPGHAHSLLPSGCRWQPVLPGECVPHGGCEAAGAGGPAARDGRPDLGLRRVHGACRRQGRGSRPVAERLAAGHPRRPGRWRASAERRPGSVPQAGIVRGSSLGRACSVRGSCGVGRDHRRRLPRWRPGARSRQLLE